MKTPIRTHSAFTLVELLVVIGIMAILIALLMPALSKVRKQALEVTCAANLRSVGQALTMYVQESRRYPAALSWGGRVVIWPTRLRGFAGGEQRLFSCPAQVDFEWKPGEAAGEVIVPAGATEAAWFGYRIGEPLLFTSRTHLTYGYNGGAGGVNIKDRTLGDIIIFLPNGQPDPQAAEIHATRVRRPAEMIAIGDSVPDGHLEGVIGPGIYFMSSSAWPGTIHRGGANILFCDGHVTWYAQKELVDFTGPQGEARRRMWYNDHEP